MRCLRFLLLAAVALFVGLAPADAASRFWVGGAGTWDNSATTHWSATTGGANGASPPTSIDTATFDGASGGGTVTVNATISVLQLTGGAFTGTLDFSANNNNITIGGNGFSFSGAGTRTLNLGNGTWTLNGTSAALWTMTTTTGLTFNANSSTILFSAVPAGNRTFIGGGLAYNNLTVTNASLNQYQIALTGSNTFANITMTNVGLFNLASGSTTTVSGTLSYSGSSGTQGYLGSTTGAAATLSVAGANALSWLYVQQITKAGAGSITCTNCFDGGGNTGVSISGPTGGGGHIIGG